MEGWWDEKQLGSYQILGDLFIGSKQSGRRIVVTSPSGNALGDVLGQSANATSNSDIPAAESTGGADHSIDGSIR